MFEPAQPQRWDPVEGFRPSLNNSDAQKELRRWAIIAVGALAVAGIFALLLAISRIPGADTLFPWPVAFYEKSLIIHVVFSFVVWFVAGGAIFLLVAAYRLSDGRPLLRTHGHSATAAMAIAFICLAVPALMDRGTPSLNNYIPAIIDPIYYVGLLLITFAAALVSARTIVNAIWRRGPLEPLGVCGLTGSVVLVVAIAAFAVSYQRIGGMPLLPADNEELFWAGGHILQFFNTALMMGAWLLLGGRAFGQPVIRPKAAITLFGLLGLLALGGFGLLFAENATGISERQLFTLYQYALAPAPTVMGALIGLAILKMHRLGDEAARTAFITLTVSMIVFFTGGLLGIFVDGADTRTPAHYHGVIGGVNVALMGYFYFFVLPILNRGLKKWRAARIGIWLYGIGQLLHSVGLFVAGGYGAPRKVADTAPGIDEFINWAGHVGIGIGGVIAVFGGILFIWISLKHLFAKQAG